MESSRVGMIKVERANIGRAERGDAEGVQSRKEKSRSLTPFGMTA
jgi:hypothetical protein